MRKWFAHVFLRPLRRLCEREIRRLLRLNDFENAHRLTSLLVKNRPDDPLAHQLHAHALLGLEYYQEALSIADRFDSPATSCFAQIKCRALYGMDDLEALAEYAQSSRQQYRGETVFTAYWMMAAHDAGLEADVIRCVDELVENAASIDEPWQFIVLWDALLELGDTERAPRIADLARSRYPHDPGIARMSEPG